MARMAVRCVVLHVLLLLKGAMHGNTSSSMSFLYVLGFTHQHMRLQASYRQRHQSGCLHLSGRAYMPFKGLTGEADKRALSIQNDLISSDQNRTAQDCVDALQAWMDAYQENPSDDKKSKVLEYGDKMEEILDYMEENLNLEAKIDA